MTMPPLTLLLTHPPIFFKDEYLFKFVVTPPPPPNQLKTMEPEG